MENIKSIVLSILLAVCLYAGLSYAVNMNYYNGISKDEASELPVSVVVDGKVIFVPQQEHYTQAGWGQLLTSVVSNYYEPTGTNYVTSTNIDGHLIYYKVYESTPIIVSKPDLIQAAEQQYLACWQAFFGSDSHGYTNATRTEVVMQVAVVAAQNPSLYALTHVMETSFDAIEEWWTPYRGDNKFHPYPWGLTTNIVIKDVVFQ